MPSTSEHSLIMRPNWIKVKAPNSTNYHETRNLVKDLGLSTVCQEAACPNIGECWTKKHATMMILGPICTRACRYCNVSTGKPDEVDPDEPRKLAQAVKMLSLQHVVITSVDRDDLEDGGASHFVACIKEIRALTPKTTIEILTPDFLRKPKAIDIIATILPDVFNHNIETVPSLYKMMRPGGRYYGALNLLHTIKKLDNKVFTKSGMMVGLGETDSEIFQVMDDLRIAEVDFLTIGQYLQPTKAHTEVKRYVEPEKFKYYEQVARLKGFLMVSASPLTRSSYHAGEDFKKLQEARSNAIL